jgi:hypothetical protein
MSNMHARTGGNLLGELLDMLTVFPGTNEQIKRS